MVVTGELSLHKRLEFQYIADKNGILAHNIAPRQTIDARNSNMGFKCDERKLAR